MKRLCFLLLLLMISTFGYSNEFNNSFSQTGFSGILRTPHASTIHYGDASFALNWEEDINYQSGYTSGAHNTILLGFGVLPGVEFSLQNSYKSFKGKGGFNSGAASDLAFYFKISSEHYFKDWPVQFALGANDVGGMTKGHRNYYSVLSYPYDNFEIKFWLWHGL